MKPSTLLKLLYVAVAIVELLAETIHIDWLRYTFKPLLMIILSLWYWNEVKGRRARYDLLVLGGFAFSWVGDISLMFLNISEKFFLVGLSAFLVAHLFYITAFSKARTDSTPSLLKRKPYYIIPFLLFLFSLLYVLYDGMGAMKIPVFAYAFVIIAMAVASFNRHGKTTAKSFYLVFIGALLFVFSDTLIAVNKFLYVFEYARFFIMLTYITAQYLIAVGCARHRSL